MESKIYLGTVKKDWDGNSNALVQGQSLYVTKHEWRYDWYWGFGYVGNAGMHTHFDSAFFINAAPNTASQIFSDPQFTDVNWWVVRDLFVQAYALKGAAEVYKHGGHQTTRKGVTDIIINNTISKSLNLDLEIVLDKLWQFMIDCTEGQKLLKQKIEKQDELVVKLEDEVQLKKDKYQEAVSELKRLKRQLN